MNALFAAAADGLLSAFAAPLLELKEERDPGRQLEALFAKHTA